MSPLRNIKSPEVVKNFSKQVNIKVVFIARYRHNVARHCCLSLLTKNARDHKSKKLYVCVNWIYCSSGAKKDQLASFSPHVVLWTGSLFISCSSASIRQCQCCNYYLFHTAAHYLLTEQAGNSSSNSRQTYDRRASSRDHR